MKATEQFTNFIPVENTDSYTMLLEGVSHASLFEQLVQNAPDLLYTVNDSGMFSFVNMRAEETTGYSKEELLNMNFLDLIEEEYRQEAKQFYLKQVVRGPKVSYFEFPIRTKEGKQVWIGQKVVVHGEDASLGFQAIARDISDKKQSELELVELKEEYKTIFDNAVQGIFQSAVSGKMISANPALLRMLGYDSLAELASINLEELYINPEDRERLHQLLSTKGKCSNIELKLKRKDGRTVTVLVHSRAVKDSRGEIFMYEGIIEDVTAKKAIEEQTRQYMEALKTSEQTLRELHDQKNKMCSIVSHDLRSPLAGMIGFCDLLLQNYDRVPKEEHLEYISYIKDAAKTQLRFVNDLLDFTKLDSGQANIKMKEVDLYLIIREAITSLLGVAKQKNIALSSSLTRSIFIDGDERWLLQAFTNIIDNALKFTNPGGAVTVTLNSVNDNTITVDVTDTGIGIPAEALPKLFRVEEKYSTNGTQGERGNGLGLPICNEIIRKHGGTLAIESSPERGTTVRLTFASLHVTTHSDILIVDDDPIFRVLHSHYVEHLFPQCKVYQATDGLEGLKIIEDMNPKVIITDYAMPKINGLEFIRMLKNNPKTSDIPVLVITGDSSKANSEALILAGARAVISKPIIHDEFQEIFKRLLNEK